MRNTKNIIYLILLFVQLCVGQEVYKVTEGELQYINRELGVILKKGDKYFSFKINSLELYGLQDGVTTQLYEIAPEVVLNYRDKPETILAGDIDPSGLKDFENYRFIVNNRNNDTLQLYKYNNEFLAIRYLDKRIYKRKEFKTVEYIILDFGKGKKVIYIGDYYGGTIIPSKRKIHFFIKDLNEYSPNKVRLKPLKLPDLAELYFRTSYKIDTLKNNRLVIKNAFNRQVINVEFDSVWHNNCFIIGYYNNKYSIYNNTFTNLKLNGIRAFSFKDHFPLVLQVIQNNKLRHINIGGSDYKHGRDGPTEWSGDDLSGMVVDFKVYKENNSYYIYSNDMFLLTVDFQVIPYKEVYKIYHDEDVEDFEFVTDENYHQSFDVDSFRNPVKLYSRLKNGKYNINTIDYLLSENPSEVIERKNEALPKNLDSIQEINPDIYLISKNGLQTYYPIMKDIKYKKIDEFIDNFARFELPDGSKGWLSLDGREYMDE